LSPTEEGSVGGCHGMKLNQILEREKISMLTIKRDKE
jgi:hypothetical protein